MLFQIFSMPFGTFFHVFLYCVPPCMVCIGKLSFFPYGLYWKVVKLFCDFLCIGFYFTCFRYCGSLEQGVCNNSKRLHPDTKLTVRIQKSFCAPRESTITKK